jgi:bacterial/archaeal transporter family-2 protein
MSQPLMPILLVLLGGAAISVQAPINGALARSLMSPVAAAAVSFGVGFAVLALFTTTQGGSALARLGAVPLWQIAGGLLGAFYIFAMTSAIGSLGVVTAMSALVLGQLVTALLLDRIGAFGLMAQPVSPQRIAAVVLVGLGLVLSRL